MSLLDFFNREIAPLAEQLDEHLGIKRINVKYVPTRNMYCVIPFKNRQHIVFLDEGDAQDVLKFDCTTGRVSL